MMRPLKLLPIFLLCLALLLLIVLSASAQSGEDLTPEQELGKSIFFDDNLSINQNQACAVCHAPEVGWTGPIEEINVHGSVYEGSILGRFGNRKPPSSAYATNSPVLHYVIEKKEALFIGGNFWNGRATGEKLGNPAADQAQGPFLNPLEQALPDSACVVYRVCNPVVPADYPVSLEDIWGADACDITWPADIEAACAPEGVPVMLSPEDRAKADIAYDQIALSIAAYEDSPEVNAFSSKYDCYLAGKVDLTKEEKKGLNMFKSKGKCAACHILDPGPNGEPALFTDYTFDNLGVPRNPENPFYYADPEFNPEGYAWVDEGLGSFLASRGDYEEFAEENLGKHKVPTLRNVGLGSCEFDPDNPDCIVKAYTHNGYFTTLKDVVHFYSTRDRKPTCSDPFTTAADALAQGCWPEPEIADNVNTGELGKLNLTEAQEDAIVAFMMTLSDGYMCP